MKKKSIQLKKLNLSKVTLSSLNTIQKNAAKGGGGSWTGCNSFDCTYDPQMGCESYPRPGMQCV